MKMWSSVRRVLQDLLSQPAARSFSLTSVQNTVVVERWWQVPLSKRGSPPRLYPRRHRIYKFVENTNQSRREKMELILTQTVPKLGGRGDTVFVKKSIGRNKLLPEGLAVYPSPENKAIFDEELRLLREGKPEERVQTRTGQRTLEYLKNLQMKMSKMPTAEFQLTKEVVCRRFLRKGIVIPPEAMNFPFENVSDVGDYWCEVTINGMDTVRVPFSVVPFTKRGQRLETVEQDDQGISESADMVEESAETVCENFVNPINQTEGSHRSDDTSSEGPRKD